MTPLRAWQKVHPFSHLGYVIALKVSEELAETTKKIMDKK